MSKTYKDLPERIKARLEDKGTGRNKGGGKEDRSFEVSKDFWFLSSSVDAIEEFKGYLEGREIPFVIKEDYGYLITEKHVFTDGSPLEDYSFPELKRLESVAPFSSDQSFYSEKFQAQEALEDMNSKKYSETRKLLGPDLWTSVRATVSIQDEDFLKPIPEEDLYSLPKTDSQEKIYEPRHVKSHSAERRRVHQDLATEAKNTPGDFEE